MRILVMVVVVILVSVCTTSSEIGDVFNCMAGEFLDSSRTFWQCRVLCDLLPEADRDMGKNLFNLTHYILFLIFVQFNLRFRDLDIK